MKTKLLVMFTIISVVLVTLMVTVQLAEGQASSSLRKTYASPAADPLAVTGVTPDTIVNNTSHILTVSGTGFTNTLTVSIGLHPWWKLPSSTPPP